MSGSSHGEVVIIDEAEMEIVQHEDLPSSKEKKSMLSMLAEVASATLSTPNAKNKVRPDSYSTEAIGSDSSKRCSSMANGFNSTPVD